jgi:glycosyltransferase involved in cell wall biosynthesis
MTEWIVWTAAVIFWLSAAGIAYAYVGYPVALALLAKLRSVPVPVGQATDLPGVTMIVPVHNEAGVLLRKLENIRAIDYPSDRLEVLVVSDGSTDGGPAILKNQQDARIVLIELAARQGKAAALNAGVARARHDILVFSDASIMLAPDAIKAIVRPFQRADVGCVSGEDVVVGSGGEGLYGRYELALRRLESRVFSIVGASGSFYAQRKSLCGRFEPGVAPDFLSVLRTVKSGFCAVAAPDALGTMTALENSGDEFRRKVRTILRGLTTLFEYRSLLNPLRYPLFSFELFSHKLARWLVPFFLLALLGSNIVLARTSAVYGALLVVHVAFYAVAATPLIWRGAGTVPLFVKIPVYFTTVNAATLSAWIKYFAGERQELWTPSRR